MLLPGLQRIPSPLTGEDKDKGVRKLMNGRAK